MPTPDSPVVFNRNKDAIREKIQIEIKRWRLLEAEHILKMDGIRGRHARATLERLFWLDASLGYLDPYDVARWVQQDFSITVLIAMAELLYGAESVQTEPTARIRLEEDPAEAAFWNGLTVVNPPPDGTPVKNLDIHCADEDFNCEGDLRWLRAKIYCNWHSAQRRGLVSGENRPAKGTTP